MGQYSRRTEPTRPHAEAVRFGRCGRGRSWTQEHSRRSFSRILSPVRRRGTRAPAPAGAAGAVCQPRFTALTENLSCEALSAPPRLSSPPGRHTAQGCSGAASAKGGPLGHGRGPERLPLGRRASLARDVTAARQPGAERGQAIAARHRIGLGRGWGGLVCGATRDRPRARAGAERLLWEAGSAAQEGTERGQGSEQARHQQGNREGGVMRKRCGTGNYVGAGLHETHL